MVELYSHEIFCLRRALAQHFWIFVLITSIVASVRPYNKSLEQILQEIQLASANVADGAAAYAAAAYWNNELLPYQNAQNSYLHMTEATNVQHETIHKIHHYLLKHHDQIAKEVLAVLEGGYRGFPMTEVDEAQAHLLQGDDHWTNIWVTFLDTWAATAPLLPTLRNITAEVIDELFLMRISIFWPGTEVAPHHGILAGVLRYQYGLIVPDGDMGLTLYNDEDDPSNRFDYRWHEEEGIVWDDTIEHSAYNFASEPRILVFADVYRELPEPLDTLNKAVHKHFSTLPYVQQTAAKIASEGHEFVPEVVETPVEMPQYSFDEIIAQMALAAEGAPAVAAPYLAIKNVWNEYIIPHRDVQNKYLHMVDAATAPHEAVRKLHALLKKNHQQLVKELQAVLAIGYKGIAMTNFDEIQYQLMDGDERWSNIWIKLLDTYAGSSLLLPTLTNITQQVEDEVFLLHVSLFWPGVALKPHCGAIMGALRYQYGLIIPPGNMGLKVFSDDGSHQDYRWQEGEGILWDDTITHTAYSDATEPRALIYVDIYRELPLWPLHEMNRAVHRHLQTYPHMEKLQKRLASEGLDVVERLKQYNNEQDMKAQTQSEL